MIKMEEKMKLKNAFLVFLIILLSFGLAGELQAQVGHGK